MVVTDHRQVPAGRTKILPDRQNVAAHLPQIVKNREQFVGALAQPHHDARLGEHPRGLFLGNLQQTERPRKVSLRSGLGIQPGNGFQVVAENLRTGFGNGPQVGRVAQKVGNQHLDGTTGNLLTNAADGVGKKGGATIREIIPGDRSDYGMPEAHGSGSLGDSRRFLHLCRALGPAVALHGTKATTAGADAAENEESGGTAPPAFGHVGAESLFAYRVEPSAPHQRLETMVGPAGRQGDFQPRGLGNAGGRTVPGLLGDLGHTRLLVPGCPVGARAGVQVGLRIRNPAFLRGCGSRAVMAHRFRHCHPPSLPGRLPITLGGHASPAGDGQCLSLKRLNQSVTGMCRWRPAAIPVSGFRKDAAPAGLMSAPPQG